VEILGITDAQFFTFMLVLIRLGALFAFAPIFGSGAIPGVVKSALVLGLTLALTALGVPGQVAVPASTGHIALLVVQELLFGIVLGYIAGLVFAAVQLAGQSIGMNMGLGIVSVMDPQFETQVSVISQFQTILATLLFLAIGGERLLVEVFAANLSRVPPGQMSFGGPLIEVLVFLTAEVFRVGLQVSAPVIAAMFAANVLLGIFARSVPQMNMLILGFPLKIFVGFAVMGLGLDYVARVILRAFAETFEALHGVASLLG
jgi:flagellar biosynthetic protein FliR